MRHSRWFAPLVLVVALVTAGAILYCAYVTLSPEYLLGLGMLSAITVVVLVAVVLVWWRFSHGPDRGPDPPKKQQ